MQRSQETASVTVTLKRRGLTFRLGLIASLGLAVCLFCQQAARGEGQRVELKPVLEYKPKLWRDWPRAVLTPGGDQVHFLSGPTLQVVDVKTQRVMAKADYANLACKGAREFYAWNVLRDRQQIVANYCSSLLLIDSRTLQVLRQFPKSNHEYVGVVTVSPDGLRAAVEVYGTDHTNFHSRIVILDSQTLTEEKSWPIDARHVGFSEDGRLVALERRGVGPDKRVTWCSLEIRHLSSGTVVADWRVDKQNSDPLICPGLPTFIPGRKSLVAAHLIGEWSLAIWDFEKRAVIREFKSLRPVGQFLVSPDGSFIIAEVANDPQDTPEYNQDFIIWDIDSGSVLYESPKVKWNPLEKVRSAFLKGDVKLNGFSADGKYLLVTRHKRLTLYEVNVTAGKR